MAPSGSQAELSILGAVRDGGALLEQTLGVIDRLRARIPASDCIIATNDNSDGTLDSLTALGGGYDVLRLDGLAEAIPDRIERLCQVRNICLARLAAHPRRRHVLVLDLDGPNTALDIEYLSSLLDPAAQSWDALFANQAEAYYDLFALRHPLWCPRDPWRELHRARKARLGLMSRRRLIARFIHARQYRIPPDHARIAVDSAFGGLGLYRRAALAGHWYATGPRRHRAECEHVGLHRGMRAARARLFIDPALLNAAPPEHLGADSGRPFPQTLSRQ